MSRVSCKDIFMGFRSIVFENKRIFIKKKLFCMQPLWFTAASLMVYSPLGKGMVLWKILFQNRNGHGKR